MPSNYRTQNKVLLAEVEAVSGTEETPPVPANAGKVGGNPAELVKHAVENNLPLWAQTKVNLEVL